MREYCRSAVCGRAQTLHMGKIHQFQMLRTWPGKNIFNH